MITLIRRITRRTAPAEDTAPAPAPASAAELLADAEAAEAARLAIEERRKLAAAETAAKIAEAEDAARIAAVAHKADLERRRREARQAEEARRAAEATRQRDLDAKAARRAERRRTLRVKIATIGERARRLAVNVVVNAGAGYGQASYFVEHLSVPLAVAVMLAAGLELIAVTVLDYGLAARKAERPYKTKFAAAGLLAGLVAYLNYSHWSATSDQQDLAVPLAILSLLCPVLWAWYAAARDAETAPVRDLAGAATRSRKSSKIAAVDQQDHANKIAAFTPAQWLMWPRQTLAAKRIAIRYGISDPDEAYRAAAQQAADKIAAKRDKIEKPKRAIKAAEERAAAADAARAEIEHTVTELRERLTAMQAALDTAQRRELEPAATPMRYLPTPDEIAAMSDAEKRDSAEDAYRTARAENVDIPGALLGAHYGFSESWGRDRRRRVKHLMRIELEDEPDDADTDDAGNSAAHGG